MKLWSCDSSPLDGAAVSYVRPLMQIRSSRIWTRRNEVWRRRRTWRTEDRESAAVPWDCFFGGVCREERGCTSGVNFSAHELCRKLCFSWADKCVEAESVGMRWREERLVLFSSGGLHSRAGGCCPLTIPTRCRGSAAVSGERARSCRCPRAGRKPGITMAECFSSTTTPGKLRGLTPEIGTWGPGVVGSHTHTYTHTE